MIPLLESVFILPLEHEGKASKTQIAKDILGYDFSQVEYYEKITNNMVGRILRKHSVVTKDKNQYMLNGFEQLSPHDVQELIRICEDKIETYVQKRGNAIWEHRRRNRKALSGSMRYAVLKRAKGRCELCGISKEEKALEVDHIVPKNHGGEDSLNNYQALCFTCNANKRDTDDTDFRNLEALYEEKENSCVFCFNPSTTVTENNLALAFYDKYPVTQFHILIIPKRHCTTYFDLTQAELNAIHSLAHLAKDLLLKKDSTIEGFNLGFNSGESAGQTIFHCHLHLIPRRKGDVDNPVGGIRNVIPEKANYKVY